MQVHNGATGSTPHHIHEPGVHFMRAPRALRPGATQTSHEVDMQHFSVDDFHAIIADYTPNSVTAEV